MPKLTRRQFLGGLGLAGISGAACAGVSLPLFTDLISPRPATRIAIITDSDSPTAAGGPAIIARADWGALAPNHAASSEFGFYSAQNPAGWRVYDEPLTDSYQTVVLHHSVIEEASDRATLQTIQELHRQDRRWADVGYHYFIGKSGQIYAGRDIRVRGVHVEGHNSGSLGICLFGDYTRQQPAPAQIRACGQLITWLKPMLGLTHLATHRDFNANTLCPGEQLSAYALPLATEAGLLLGTDGYIGPQAACSCGSLHS